MKFIPEILLFALFIYLYVLFSFAKDNFTLLRKNITLEYLFNISFISFIISLLVARVVYVIEHISPIYLNPLVLFLFPYFPGLSVSGGIIGFTICIFYLTRQKRIPFWNIFDIFSLSLSFSFFFTELIIFIISLVFQYSFSIADLIGSCILLFSFILCLILYLKNVCKDGSVGYLIITLLLMAQEGNRAIMRGKSMFRVGQLTTEDYILSCLFFVYLILFFHRQLIIKK